MQQENNHLYTFFERIKNLGFWQRLFGWTKIKALSYNAYEEYRLMKNMLKDKEQELETLKAGLAELKNESKFMQSRYDESAGKNKELNEEKIRIEERFRALQEERNKLDIRVTQYQQKEESKATEYDKKMEALLQARNDIKEDQHKLQQEREQEKEEAFARMKATWSEHEKFVETAIKKICNKHIIHYVDKVPFRGNPDNTIEICDEYIIFDAKSPANDDLSNFPRYIKTQVEALKKYARQEQVKKDLFLVVPSNTVEVLNEFSHKLADYNVFVVTADALEPIILCLKKVEEYEFAEQLSPEERDNICRLIGKFAHTTKRKIQVDHFFTNEFLQILSKCKTDLPKDLLEKVIEFERAEKLNPPQEKRSKAILTKDLIETDENIWQEADAKGISELSPANSIKELPLYKDEKKPPLT